jgi:hypothetical protein
VHVLGRLVYYVHQVSDKLVHNNFFFIVVAQFKSVVEKYVNCERSNI